MAINLIFAFSRYINNVSRNRISRVSFRMKFNQILVKDTNMSTPFFSLVLFVLFSSI
jgi:hypothetical protein